jgi:hypothetical protein
MNPTHRTRRLSVTLAGLAAGALALSACQGTATAASHSPPHHATQAIAQQTPTGLTVADLQNIAEVKRDLFWKLAHQTQTGTTGADLQDLDKAKRDLFQKLAERSPRQQTAADSPGKTPEVGTVSLSARHAPAYNRFTELLALDQVKRAVAWAEVERAWTRQPQTGASRLTDQRELARVKRQAAWNAADRAIGR